MSASLVRLNYSVRRFTDDSLDVSDLADRLSPFQIEKLSYLFKSLDQTKTGFIDVSQENKPGSHLLIKNSSHTLA